MILSDITIKAADLITPGGLAGLRGLQATNVRFQGPAVLFINGNFQMNGTNTFEATPEGLIWDIDPTRSQFAGCIPLVDPVFTDCTFDNNIGIAATAEDLARLLLMMNV